MVDGSNESLYYPDEESDLNLRTGTPLQKSFEKVDVLAATLAALFLPYCCRSLDQKDDEI